MHVMRQNAKTAFWGIHRMKRDSGFSRSIGRAVIAGGALLACMHAAQAAPIAPPTGFEPDEGTSFFLPNDSVFGIEIVDAGGATFGFYYALDPSTRVTVMDATDTGAPGSQRASINFLTGLVFDVDALAPQNTFTVENDAIGFFLTLSGVTYFSDATLNPIPFDTFSAFESSVDPDLWAVAFDLPTIGVVYTARLVGVSPVSAVPEPSALLLLVSAFPALVIIGLRRRFACLTA